MVLGNRSSGHTNREIVQDEGYRNTRASDAGHSMHHGWVHGITSPTRRSWLANKTSDCLPESGATRNIRMAARLKTDENLPDSAAMLLRAATTSPLCLREDRFSLRDFFAFLEEVCGCN